MDRARALPPPPPRPHGARSASPASPPGPPVAGYLAFAWFEIVSLAPTDPAVLARAVLGYWLVILVLAVLEGEAWLDRGEAFTVYFAMVARIAPLWTEAQGGRVRHWAGLPGTQILAMPPLSPSGAAFVALVLAAVSFDGLAETFRWLAFLGVNPLEFPGRSAVVVPNTLGLLAAWPLTFGLILGAIALGRPSPARRGRSGTTPARGRSPSCRSPPATTPPTTSSRC